MNFRYLLIQASAILLLAFVFATPAAAQAARTWVGGQGDDSNPCSRTSPCRTFMGALSKTAAGGEINCIDPGGFGAVTITKAITIDCGEVGAILAASTNGIVISAAAADVVVLRNLVIDGAVTGLNGIRVLSAGMVVIDTVQIGGFMSGTAFGIDVNPASTPLRVFVRNSIISGGGTGAGINVRTLPNVTVDLALENVSLIGSDTGLNADGTGAGGGVILISMNDSVAALNSVDGIAATSPAGGATIVMMIHDTMSSHNTGGFGVLADGGNVSILLGGMSIFANAVGVGAQNGGNLTSYTTNQINGNGKDGTPIPSGALS